MIEPADLVTAFKDTVSKASFLIDGAWIYLEDAIFRAGYGQIRGTTDGGGECFISCKRVSAFIIYQKCEYSEGTE